MENIFYKKKCVKLENIKDARNWDKNKRLISNYSFLSYVLKQKYLMSTLELKVAFVSFISFLSKSNYKNQLIFY